MAAPAGLCVLDALPGRGVEAAVVDVRQSSVTRQVITGVIAPRQRWSTYRRRWWWFRLGGGGLGIGGFRGIGGRGCSAIASTGCQHQHYCRQKRQHAKVLFHSYFLPIWVTWRGKPAGRKDSEVARPALFGDCSQIRRRCLGRIGLDRLKGELIGAFLDRDQHRGTGFELAQKHLF